MDPVNPVLLGEGRWLTGDASARASEETGMQLDPMQARLDESLRYWKVRNPWSELLGRQLKQQNHSYGRIDVSSSCSVLLPELAARNSASLTE